MFRSGWASKHSQEHILAITMTRSFFHQILASSIATSYQPTVHASQAEYDKMAGEAKMAKQGWARYQVRQQQEHIKHNNAMQLIEVSSMSHLIVADVVHDV